jgi:hypothetical protein
MASTANPVLEEEPEEVNERAKRFLENRQRVRDEQQKSKARRDDGREGEDKEERKAYDATRERLHAHIQELLAAQPPKVKEAKEVWLQLQETIRCATQFTRLPSHELKLANSLLSHLFAKITEVGREVEGQGAGRKMFKFSDKVKLCTKQDVIDRMEAKKRVKETAAAGGATSTTTATGISIAADAEVAVEGKCIVRDRQNEKIFIGTKDACFLRRLTDCTIHCLPINGSVFLDGCRNSTLYVCCHQLRMKNCFNVKVLVACRSTPIIEACRDVAFGPYSAWAGLTGSDWSAAARRFLPAAQQSGHEPEGERMTHQQWAMHFAGISTENWSGHAEKSFEHIDDFDWLKQQQSPHWRVFAQDEVNALTSDVPFPVENAL